MDQNSMDDTTPPDSGADAATVPGANVDPTLLAVLQGLRGSGRGDASAGWSILTDEARVRAVNDTGLLEPGPHPAIDQLVGLTIQAVGIPYAALNMITDVEQTTASVASRAGDMGDPGTRPVASSLCVYTVMTGSPLIIDDVADQPVLGDHPAVESGVVSAYIGIPIFDDAGQAVGTLCAWDTEPHHWSSGEVQIMTDLADAVRSVIFDQ